jgi:MFS family permease
VEPLSGSVIDPGRGSAFHALRSRDFRLLWSGQTVSLVGNAAFFVAIGWRTQALTGSSRSLALVLMLYSVAMLATLLIGGALADRYERRNLMIVSDLSRMVVVAVLAAVDATGHLSLPLLLGFAVAVGLGDGFFHPAFGGIVPLVVEQPLLASANALIGISRNGSFVIGPALAAFLYGGVGSATVFAFDAGSFLVSATLLWRARPRRFAREPSTGTLREIAAGFRYVASVPWLWISIGLAAFVLMIAMAPYQSLLPKLVELNFHRGVGAYGLLFSLQAVGMVAGTLVFGQTNPRRHRVIFTYTAFALNDVCVIGMALTGQYVIAAVLVVVRGVFIGFGIAIWETVLMELVPERMLSRVISLDFFGSFGLTPVGYALTAAVSGMFTPSQILLVGFTLSTVLWIAPLSLRRVREAA